MDGAAQRLPLWDVVYPFSAACVKRVPCEAFGMGRESATRTAVWSVRDWMTSGSQRLAWFLSLRPHSPLILKVSTDLLFLSPDSIYRPLTEAFAWSSSLRYNLSALPS